MEKMSPNILFILTDQQRWDALSFINPDYITPNLQKFSESSVVFENCFTNSPACIPARFSLATGLHPSCHGITDNCNANLSQDLGTWMKEVRMNGYETYAIGKTHLHHHKGDLRKKSNLMHKLGFNFVDEMPGPKAMRVTESNIKDLWQEIGIWNLYKKDIACRKKSNFPYSLPLPFAKEYYPDSYVKDKFIEYINCYKSDKPWCGFLGFPGPHEPYDAPTFYLDKYKNHPISQPRMLEKGFKIFNESSVRKRMRLAQENISEGKDFHSLRKDYAASITFIDDLIGQIFSFLKKKGLFDNTLIVFSSDHGEMNGDYGLLMKKTFFDGSVKVPLIIKPPSPVHVGSQVIKQDVALFDISATILDYSSELTPSSKLFEFNHARSLRCFLENNYSQFGDKSKNLRAFSTSFIKDEIMYADRFYKFMLNTNGRCFGAFDRFHDSQESCNLAEEISSNKRLRRHLNRAKNELFKTFLRNQGFANKKFSKTP